MKRILLVDDSRFFRAANERTLVRAGYAVITASDGLEALETAQSQVPDLIVLDMLLPKLDGLQVLRALKKHPATSGIPVIVLTSLTQKNERKVLADGACAYLEKSRMDPDGNIEGLLQQVSGQLNLAPSRQPA